VAVRLVPLGRDHGGELGVQRDRGQVEPGTQVAAADAQAPAARETVGRGVARAVEHEPAAAVRRRGRGEGAEERGTDAVPARGRVHGERPVGQLLVERAVDAEARVAEQPAVVVVREVHEAAALVGRGQQRAQFGPAGRRVSGPVGEIGGVLAGQDLPSSSAGSSSRSPRDVEVCTRVSRQGRTAVPAGANRVRTRLSDRFPAADGGKTRQIGGGLRPSE
jgi:hypothetical protein